MVNSDDIDKIGFLEIIIDLIFSTTLDLEAVNIYLLKFSIDPLRIKLCLSSENIRLKSNFELTKVSPPLDQNIYKSMLHRLFYKGTKLQCKGFSIREKNHQYPLLIDMTCFFLSTNIYYIHATVIYHTYR